MSVSSQQSQWPFDWILVLLVQDQLGEGHLDLSQADLLALVVDVDHFEELVVWQENAPVVESFEDALRLSAAHDDELGGDECVVSSGKRDAFESQLFRRRPFDGMLASRAI